MSLYSTLYIKPEEAIQKIQERLPGATNTQIQRCLDQVSDYLEHDRERTEMGRQERVGKILFVLTQMELEKIASSTNINIQYELLGNVMDTLYSHETLNNYLVVDEPERY